MTTFELIISKLQAAGCDPRIGGVGYYQARCPVHFGKKSNLDLYATIDGDALLYCRHRDEFSKRTCTKEEILEALRRLEEAGEVLPQDRELPPEDLEPLRDDRDPLPEDPGPLLAVDPAVEAPIRLPQWPDPPDAAALGGLAGEVVRLIEPETEADPAAVLLQLLVGFGNAIGSGVYVLADGHLHHANEYAVIVGDTSRARKGTAWRRVRAILAHFDSTWADNKITGGLSSGEGLIW